MTADVGVVTGSGRGIGREIAHRLSARGLHVVVTDLDGDAARQTAAALPVATALAHDVRDPAAHRAVAEQAGALGRLTVWVNNAGVLHAGLPWELDDAAVTRMVEVNLLGVVHGSRAAVAAMSAQAGGGDLVNIASLSAFGPVPGVGVYAATKAAVVGFTTSLAGDLRWAGLDEIRVHAFCPDAADTDLVRDVSGDPHSALLHTGSRLLAPGTVADAVVGLLGGRTLVRSLPRRRAALLRAVSVAPAASLRLLPYFRATGERRRVRAAGGQA